jgi:uncharacterized protein with NRDE domain
MCLILFAYRTHLEYPMILAANRDEFYERPSRPMEFWGRDRGVLAGRDGKAGGTWMGITREGRYAAITNYRDPSAVQTDAPSRGELVSDFLTGSSTPQSYLSRVRKRGHRYNGYNLLCGDAKNGLWYHSNRSSGEGVEPVAPGVHGLSNHLLNTPWPKLERGTAGVRRISVAAGKPDTEALFRLLRDRSRPPDAALPDTGVGIAWERVLSPMFIVSEHYGTRSSTVLLWDRRGKVSVEERTWIPADGIQVRNGPVVKETFTVSNRWVGTGHGRKEAGSR